jgi:hypothetical protein
MRGLLVALGLLLAVTWIGGGYALYYVIRDDDTLSRKAASQSAQLSDASRKMAQLQADNVRISGELRAAKTELAHPTLGLWNVSEAITGPDAYLSGGMPDTFTYHLKFTADAPVSVRYMTSKQFVNAIPCVEVGRGNSNSCLSLAGMGWNNVTTLEVDIHEAEGCADYLVIFTAARATTVHPDVSVTYNPAPAPTAACAA